MAGILDEFLLIFKPQVQGSGFQKLNNSIKQTTNNLFSMKNLFRTFVGYDIYSGIKQFTTSMVDATREMGAMRSRFFAITGDEAKANKQLQWAFDLAKRTAMPMKEVADSYSIFYAATQKGLGDTGAQQVFQDWTEISRVLHMSTYQFERVTYALREMASKGAIYSQDLRMQIGTHVPNAMGLAEKAANQLGYTGTQWFDNFQKAAKGNQKLINQFIVLFSKFAKEMYANPKALEKALKQPDAQLVRLKNQWDNLRYAIVDSGFSDDLMKILYVVNNGLDKVAQHSKEIYGILKSITGLLLIIFGLKGLKALGSALGLLFGSQAVRMGASTLNFLTKQLGLWKGLGVFLKQTLLVAVYKFFGISLINLAKMTKSTIRLFGILSKAGGLGKIIHALNLITKLSSASAGISLVARILPILSNPYVLGALIIAGLGIGINWLLKTQFPNVYMAISNYWTMISGNISDYFNNLIHHPFFQMLAKLFGYNIDQTDGNGKVVQTKEAKSEASTAIDKTMQDIKAHGGYFGNTKYGNFWEVNKLISDLTKLQMQSSSADVKNPLFGQTPTKGLGINLEITHHIKSDGTVDANSALKALSDKNTNTSIADAVKNYFRPKK